LLQVVPVNKVARGILTLCQLSYKGLLLSQDSNLKPSSYKEK
jgi:hypothetical protein